MQAHSAAWSCAAGPARPQTGTFCRILLVLPALFQVLLRYAPLLAAKMACDGTIGVGGRQMEEQNKWLSGLTLA